MTDGARAPDDVPKLLGLLQSLAQEALTVGKPEGFWPHMARELSSYFGCERATLFQAGGRGRLISCYAQGLTEPIAVEPGEGVAGCAAATGRACACNEPYADPRFSPRLDRLSGFKTGNLLAAPMLAQERVVGVIELVNKPGGFTDGDARAMEFLGGQIATYFLLFRLEERHDQMAMQVLQMEKMAAVGRLVAGFTHEVRNPLFVIQGYVEKLTDALGDDPGSRADLDVIRRNVQRIEHLVKNLLGFSRASKNTLGPVDLCALLETTLELVVLDSAWSFIRIEKDFDRAAPTVNGNVNTLMQVFLNLIVNAFHAMEGRKDARLALRVRGEGGRVVAEVSDNGSGMTPEVQEKIFEPFFTTKGRRGTGLGLSIVSSIVAGHGGRISVDSAPGKGTTFRLDFPPGAPI